MADLKHWKKDNIKFWNEISEFYIAHDINAWQNKVPFHVTNNPLIAQRLAKSVSHYLLDCKNQGYTGTFTIIEAGAGLGKFAFFFLEHLIKQINLLQLSPSCISYIICDRSDKTISFWKRHPQLKPHIHSGILSCCQLYINGDQNISFSGDITQLKSSRVIFLANYFFDSLYQSPFCLEDDKYVPCKISKSKSLFSKNTTLQFLPLLSEKPPYSTCTVYNDILEQHRLLFSASHVLMPDGPIKLIDWINDHTDNPVLFVITDKGFTCPKSEFYCRNFNIIQTGAYASSVNFYALHQYMQIALNGSGILFPGSESSFGTCFLLSKDQLTNYPSLTLEAHNTAQYSSSLSSSYCQKLLNRHSQYDALWDLFGSFSILNYDLTTLVFLYDSLNDLIANTEDLSEYPIEKTLNRFKENFFFTPNEESEQELICLIQFSLITKQFEFCQSILDIYPDFYGENYLFYYHYANFYFMQSDYASASDLFTAALSDNPECEHSKKYLQHCHSLLQ
ncbi:MAG: hypothetical protein VX737_04600 [Pseudomonadota bacterium]|nr:hypothetical protein [Pseudomonadota bacterium]